MKEQEKSPCFSWGAGTKDSQGRLYCPCKHRHHDLLTSVSCQAKLLKGEGKSFLGKNTDLGVHYPCLCGEKGKFGVLFI